MVWWGMVWRCMEWQGLAGKAVRGGAWLGKVGSGMARQAWKIQIESRFEQLFQSIHQDYQLKKEGNKHE